MLISLILRLRTMQLRYYIISGEASGDLHGSNLIKELIKQDPNAIIRAWGGDLMKQSGAELVKHYRDLAFMGFTEVVANLPTILKNIAFCKNDVLAFKPDVLILIDYPGFNLRIAKFAHDAGIKVVYYISPQVWAWKQSRVHTIKKVVDKMLVILPFEKEFYKKFDFDVTFVGHPLIDAIEQFKQTDKINFRTLNNLNSKPIIALLPGSRKQEIDNMLSEMAKIIPGYPDYNFVIAAAPSLSKDFFATYEKKGISVVYNQTYSLLNNSAAAVVTSGTATLETALFNVPLVVCYKGGNISYQIAKRLIKIKYISLVNLIMNKAVVKELIQDEMKAENIKQELNLILHDASYQSKMLENFAILTKACGGIGASENAAKEILALLK